ncbi:MAG: LysR family transcriptional regulator [Hydrogenophaga sp.]|jgi:DNA-binding transcriptional LysR family regulator|uniref:LysR family transcriptional regulator n=1 Tax=Hydrogenophaga sp. TaxID=1904254 RepID=UPI002636F233|nr:LysR family transcriptional regulator [Hydrogenophaga sp.]MCV0440402.1 LysR family transcriptional regulator [Hydrogenophaga sp.]
MSEAKNPLRIELRQWRQFVVLAEELHFGRAAARLHMTQPPLTQAIAGLEQTLGVRLFDRTRRSVALAPAAAALLPEVRELLVRAQGLPALARAAAAGEMGRLRLAFVSTVGFELLPRWVRAFRQRWPQIALELIEATGDVQLEMLARGEADAGMVLHSPGLQAPGLASARIASEPLVVALPESHPLAAHDHPGLAALLAEPLVIFPRRILPTLHDAIFALYHGSDRAPQVAQEAIQMQTIVNLVSAGLGLAWVPQSVRQFQRPGVVYRSVRPPRGRAMPACETSLVWRADAMSPTLAHFVDFALARAS